MTQVGVEDDGSPARPFQISAYPKDVTRQGNPYFSLYHAALAKHGIVVSDDLEIDTAWLEARRGRLGAIHLHWPESLWRRDFGGEGRLTRLVRAGRRFLHLYQFLRSARRLGMRRIWTVHNIEPHEGAYRWERYGYRLIAHHADLVICHSQSEANVVRQRFLPRRDLVVMPIGELGSAYPAARPRPQVLTELGLDPQLPVVSCLGRLRDYKRLDLACQAVARLEGRIQLIVGGVRHADYDVTSLAQAAHRWKHIVFLERKLSDQEFSDLTSASDAQLLPYRRITGSAALLSALGTGRGVVVSDLPYFREILAGEPDAGCIVPSSEPVTWADSIERYLARPASVRSSAARRLAARYSWDRSVEPVVAAIGRWGHLPASHPERSREAASRAHPAPVR